MSGRKSVLIVLLFLLFVMEGTVLPWLIPDSWATRIVPNVVLIILLFVTVYHHRHTALVLGICFGMLHDVVFYGRILGAHSLAMGVSAYLIGLIFQLPRAPLPLMMTIIMLGSWLNDSILYGIYHTFKLIQDPYNWALMHYMLPTMLVHFALGLALYIPVRRQLEKLSRPVRKEEKD